MWVAQEGGSGCVPAVGSAVRCLRVIWSGRRRAVGGALSFHNTHPSPAQKPLLDLNLVQISCSSDPVTLNYPRVGAQPKSGGWVCSLSTLFRFRYKMS